MSVVLIADTTVVAAVSTNSIPFTVIQGEVVSLRSENLDGSGNVALYYDSPDEVDNPAVYEGGTEVALTATQTEIPVNVPGTYRVAVTAAGTSAGKVFINR
jgi:hypothetical protein